MTNHPKFRAWQSGLAAAALALAVAFCATARPAQSQSLSFIRDTEIEQLLSDYAQPIFRGAGPGT